LLDRYLPFWAANLVQRGIVLVIPLVTLLLPFFKFGPPLYQWRVRRRIYKWYDNVRHIESDARAAPSETERGRSLAELDTLQSEVGKLKVPLSYADQLFALRLHIQFVRKLIENGEVAAAARNAEKA
jgi:hypothetical protein